MEPCLGKAITDTLISRWGHDTLEDKEERKRQAQAKGVIAWTDPDGALQEKKEFVWSPQRIEDEANNAIEGWLNSFLWISCELFHILREGKKRCFQSSRSAVLHSKPIVQTIPAHGCYRSCLVSRGNKKEIEKVGPRTFLLLRLSSFYNDYTIRFLVRSQIFVRERLVALGPDLAAAHFLCFKYSTYTRIHAIFFFQVRWLEVLCSSS